MLQHDECRCSPPSSRSLVVFNCRGLRSDFFVQGSENTDRTSKIYGNQEILPPQQFTCEGRLQDQDVSFTSLSPVPLKYVSRSKGTVYHLFFSIWSESCVSEYLPKGIHTLHHRTIFFVQERTVIIPITYLSESDLPIHTPILHDFTWYLHEIYPTGVKVQKHQVNNVAGLSPSVSQC